MADLPRLNNIIRALRSGPACAHLFCARPHVNSAIAMSASKFDGCVFEMEHNPWDSGTLRDCLQYMLNRAQIAKAGLVPPVTPMVRIPVNGVEMAQWQAKQALDMRLLRHRVPAHLDGRGGRQRGRRLPLSAAEERASSTSRPASAATARPPPRATGASASRTTTRRPTSGRSTRRARFSASCRSRTPAASRISTPC